MRRENNSESLKQVIRRLLRAYGLEEKMNQAALHAEWEKLMGAAIVSRTRKLNLYQGVLTIYVTSATLRYELNMGKEKIKENLNRQMGKQIIQRVEIR